MEPAAYEQWLRRGETAPAMAAAGRQLYIQLGCQGCHNEDRGAPSPPLLGRYGRQVNLADGKTTWFDDSYIRESILDPGVCVTAGYPAIMRCGRS